MRGMVDRVLKFYPDRVKSRFWRLLGDMAATFWTVTWIALGLVIYQTVNALQVIADGIGGTGHTFNGWLNTFKHNVPRGIPLVSNFLVQQATDLQHYSGDPLIAAGLQAHAQIQQAALALALLIALPPIVIVTVVWVVTTRTASETTVEPVPAGNVSWVGHEITEELLDDIATVSPPLGARPVRIAVIERVVGPTTTDDDGINVETVGANTVRFGVVAVSPFPDAVIVPVVFVATGTVVQANECEV